MANRQTDSQTGPQHIPYVRSRYGSQVKIFGTKNTKQMSSAKYFLNTCMHQSKQEYSPVNLSKFVDHILWNFYQIVERRCHLHTAPPSKIVVAWTCTYRDVLLLHYYYYYYFAPDREEHYCVKRFCMFACLSVCLSVCSHVSKTTRANFVKFSVHVNCQRGCDDNAIRC